MTIPESIYRGSGRAWVAVKDGKIVALRYMGDSPAYSVEDFLRDTGRKRKTATAKHLAIQREWELFVAYRERCLKELSALGEVRSVVLLED